MLKTLRLGFVLGGGVSLGSFSSAALAESLKQLILFADYETKDKDAQGVPLRRLYDSVEVDVFSGASAGAMSLAIMLRCLVNHRDKYKFLAFDNYMLMREAMERQLLVQFGEVAYKLKNEGSPKWESLIAVQTMQEVQAKIWIDEVNIEKLLGTAEGAKKMDESGSLVDRGVIDDVARRCFKFDKLGERLSYRSHVLAGRVLFACTLSNLNYTLNKTKAKLNESGNKFMSALNDAATDKVHSEVRVFDFNFRPLTQDEARYYPLKWVQYHQAEDLLIEQQDNNGKAYAKFVRHIERNEVWREVSATAIASGAFPMAFEPVVLNRYQYEYGENWAADLAHLTKYPFTYVDGGMFNNEPIQEAFRLAAYIDNNTSDKFSFDRRIIFIDPNVNDTERQLSANIHNKLSVSRSFLSGKSSVVSKPTMLRIASQVPHLLVAMLNESRKLDIEHITQTLSQYEWQTQQRTLLRELMLSQSASLQDSTIISQREQAKAKLDELRAALEYPNNTLQIQHEMLRIAREEAQHLAELLPFGSEELMLRSLNEFVYSPNPSQNKEAKPWGYVLSLLGLDISLNLIGKNKEMHLVPIAPFDFYKNDYSLLRLPGAGLAGFAGFTSAQVSSYEVRYGQYCAYRILAEMGMLSPDAPIFPLPNAFDYKLFDAPLRQRLEAAVLKRIKELVPKGIASTVMPFIEGFVQDKVHSFIDNNLVANAPKLNFEFRIRVGQELYALRGFAADGNTSKRNTLDAVRVDNHYYLLARLSYNTVNFSWAGDNCVDNRVHIDKVGLFSNSAALSINLPTVTPEMLRSPNPIFILDATGETSIGSYTELKSDRWHFYSEIAPLDESLWAEDNLRKLLDKM
jgi:predicted acylesterase/phospholipase RssA